MRFKLSLLLILSLIVVSLADDTSSESSDDGNMSKDDHLKDDPKEEGEKEKADEKIGDGKPTEKSKKGEKDKNKKNDYVDESEMTGADIDKLYGGGKDTEKPHDDSPMTTAEPPHGSFGSNFLDQLLSGDLESDSDDEETTHPTSEGSEEGQADCQGTHGSSGANPFYPYPRPVDVWDRLIILVAFPICFFAVMLKAKMLR